MCTLGCGKHLDGAAFYGVEGFPFCESCIDEAEALSKNGALAPRLPGAQSGSENDTNVLPIAKKGVSMSDSLPLADVPVSPALEQQTFDEHVCFKCHNNIQTTVVNAIGQSWCETCFVCNSCEKELESFFGCEDVSHRGGLALVYLLMINKALLSIKRDIRIAQIALIWPKIDSLRAESLRRLIRSSSNHQWRPHRRQES